MIIDEEMIIKEQINSDEWLIVRVRIVGAIAHGLYIWSQCLKENEKEEKEQDRIILPW